MRNIPIHLANSFLILRIVGVTLPWKAKQTEMSVTAAGLEGIRNLYLL